MAGAEAEIPEMRQVEPELAVEGRPDLPAFLKKNEGTGEYELPKGYEWVEIPARSKRQIRLGPRPGDQANFYLGNIGAILERGDKREAYFRFPGIPLPGRLKVREVTSDDVQIKGWKHVDPKGLKIGYLEGKHAEVEVTNSILNDVIDGKVEESELSSFARIFLPKTIKAGNMLVQPPYFDLRRGVRLGLDDDERYIFIKNFSIENALMVAVPSAAKKADGLRPEAEATAKKVIPVAPKAEVPAVVSPAVTSEAAAAAEMEKSWKEIALEMAEDGFAAIGFRQTGNEIVAAAAFEFRRKIADGTMKGEMFTAMMEEINRIVKHYEEQLGRPAEQVLG